MNNYRNGHRSSTPTEISGLQVVRQRRSKKERAQLAASIRSGRTRLESLTQTQVAAICDVSPGYVRRVTVVQLAAE
jgi:hypothetical protein